MPVENPKLCECGCGQPAPIAVKNHTANGYVKGQPMRYILGHNRRLKGPEYEVDAETGCWNWLRAKDRNGYGVCHAGVAHRLAYEKRHGKVSPDLHVDHICHNPSCVNPDHLRAVPPHVNAANRAGAKPGSTSKFRGVWWDKKAQRWVAAVDILGKRNHLGWFTDEEEAGAAAAEFRALHMEGSIEKARRDGWTPEEGWK